MSLPNGIEDFRERFRALMDEAQTFGIASLVVLNESDPLSGDEARSMDRRGGWANAYGLAHYAIRRLDEQDRETQ